MKHCSFVSIAQRRAGSARRCSAQHSYDTICIARRSLPRFAHFPDSYAYNILKLPKMMPVSPTEVENGNYFLLSKADYWHSNSITFHRLLPEDIFVRRIQQSDWLSIGRKFRQLSAIFGKNETRAFQGLCDNDWRCCGTRREVAHLHGGYKRYTPVARTAGIPEVYSSSVRTAQTLRKSTPHGAVGGPTLRWCSGGMVSCVSRSLQSVAVTTDTTVTANVV